jgi:prevent-host-death family protein
MARVATVGARELKTRLGGYLQQVREGRTLVITDRGQPIAELRPLPRAGEGARLEQLKVLGAVTRSESRPLAPFRPVRSRGPSVSGRDSRGQAGSRVTRYFDASALVKRYVREAGSTTVRRLLASAIPASSRLSEVEVASGIIRRAREGAFTNRARDRMLAALQRDLPALAIVEMIPEIAADVRALLLRHSLRASDAVQLGSCLYLQRQLGQPVPFVVFDRRLVAAAQAEGLTVITAAGARQRSVPPPHSGGLRRGVRWRPPSGRRRTQADLVRRRRGARMVAGWPRARG